MTTRAAIGFVGKRGLTSRLIASWFIPATLTLAYVLLALTSETGTSGWVWMGAGLVVAQILWLMFRSLTQAAALSRAVAVGDADRVLELADDVVARRRGAVRARYQLYRGVAFELRGDWTSVLRAVEAAALAADAPAGDRVLAAAIRIGALIETGEVAKARVVLDTELAPIAATIDSRIDVYAHTTAQLARGRVLAAEHSPEALGVLQRVIDDVRSGAASRAMAHHYAARAAVDSHDFAAADRHRARAAALAPGTWVAG